MLLTIMVLSRINGLQLTLICTRKSLKCSLNAAMSWFKLNRPVTNTFTWALQRKRKQTYSKKGNTNKTRHKHSPKHFKKTVAGEKNFTNYSQSKLSTEREQAYT